MAALTLFDLTYQTARKLKSAVEGTATGGTTTTVIDTVARTEDDDYWNGGTVWVLRDAGGAGAAPEKEYGEVTDFAASTDTLTLRSALTAAVAAGDKYAVARSRFPLWLLVQEVNSALQEMPPILITDTTSITTADEQTEYTLPNVANLDLREVWIQTVDDDADDNRWVKLHNWRVQFTATGTADTLILPWQYASGYDLKLVYTGIHPELHAAGDELSEQVDPSVVTNRAALGCAEWYRNKTQDNEAWLMDLITKLVQAVERDNQQKRPQHPGRTPRIIQPDTRDYYDPSEYIDKVRL
jgi:hypothetical protein